MKSFSCMGRRFVLNNNAVEVFVKQYVKPPVKRGVKRLVKPCVD